MDTDDGKKNMMRANRVAERNGQKRVKETGSPTHCGQRRMHGLMIWCVIAFRTIEQLKKDAKKMTRGLGQSIS